MQLVFRCLLRSDFLGASVGIESNAMPKRCNYCRLSVDRADGGRAQETVASQPGGFLTLNIWDTGIPQILKRKCWVGALALPQGRDEK